MYQTLLRLFLPFINFMYVNISSTYLAFYFGCKYIFEYSTVRFVNYWLHDGDIAVDVGANVGFYTSLFLKRIKKAGELYAFEPDPDNFSYLKKQFSSSKSVHLYKVAVGDKEKSIKLYFSSVHNTDHHTFDIGESRKHKTIKSVSLDKVIKKQQKVNLLKIDVQGYDYFVLKGSVKTVKRSTRFALIGEIWPYASHKAGIMPSKYVELIKSLNLKFIGKNINQIKYLDKKIDSPNYYLDFVAIKV